MDVLVSARWTSGRTYPFIGFERIGGIAVFDVTEPAASHFVTYIHNRDFSVSGTTTLFEIASLRG